MMAMDSESPFANGVSLRPRSLKKRSTSGSSGDGEELLQSERYHCVEPGKCFAASVAVARMNWQQCRLLVLYARLVRRYPQMRVEARLCTKPLILEL